MADKNKYGQYFTPKYMADFMVSLLSCNRDSQILEPSAGEGVFLSALEEAGYKNWTAYEIDGTIITTPKIICESFVTAEITPSFEAVIGNPPYIRWKNLEPILKEELLSSQLWNSTFNALCDYLFFFIAKSIEMLIPGGEIIFICSDYWLNSTNGASLRSYLLEHGHMDSIYLFRETRIFSGVTASLMVFKFKKSFSNSNIQLYTYKGKKSLDEKELNNPQNFDLLYIPQFKANKRWILATEVQQQAAHKLEQVCSIHNSLFLENREVQRIGHYFDIGNGLVSGLDKAFNVSHIEEGKLSFLEKQKTLHVIKAKNINPYRFDKVSSYIYIEDKEITENVLEISYPTFYTHLQSYKTQLQTRYQYGKSIDYWSFTFPRNKKLFESNFQRILVPCKDRITKRRHFRFCLAPQNVIPLQDVTGLLPKKNCKESLEYVLAYLNSPQVFDWLLLNGIVKGEVIEFSETPIASIPYRTIKWNDINEVSLHDQITSLVRNAITLDNLIPTQEINNLIAELLQ